MTQKVIIIGAGISGLSLALRLVHHEVEVFVLESSKTIGGLAGTIREKNYCMDVGPHSFFSDDSEILNTVLELFNNTLIPSPRQVKFYYKGKYLDYPLTAYSVLFQMGVWSGIRAGLSFIKSKALSKIHKPIEGEEETVEDWAIKSFGKHLYKTFFKPYTEQFWKMPCTELSSRTIPTHTRMSFINTLRLLLRRRFNKVDLSLIEREMLPTYYPDFGFAEIPELIGDSVAAKGVRIHTECRAVRVEELASEGMRVLYEFNGKQKEIEGTHVVSTIPINQFIKMLNPPAPSTILASADKLDYRALTTLGMVTNKQNILNCGYIYVLDRPYNRISEMNEFSPKTSPENENIIMIEIPCLRDSAAWRASKEELFDMCIGSLAKDGILGPGDVKHLMLIRAPYAYPIYRKDYAVNLKNILDYVNEHKGISTLGRTGEFIYMDIDKCMRKAFDFADNFLKNYGSKTNL
ncbi:MAG: FAD-dependent oxidoreductase [Candidatus Hodarchaeota archaeon]